MGSNDATGLVSGLPPKEAGEIVSNVLAKARGNAGNRGNKGNGENRENGLASSPDTLFNTVDAATLCDMKFDEPGWVIEGILPIGLAILGGRPKGGKSWLALNLALAVARGAEVLGIYETTQSDVLYLALEDGLRRLNVRLSMLRNGEEGRAPSNLHFKTTFRRFDNGGFDDLERFLTTKPDTRVVIIDTLQRVRGRAKGGKDSYAGDYEEIGELQRIAMEYKVLVLLVHHTTKMAHADPFDAISGTTAIAGAADTLLVLERNPDGGRTLHVRGRDVDEQSIAMKWDATTGVWRALGNATDIHLSEQRKKILEAVEGGESLGPKEIAENTELPHGSVKKLCVKMAKDGMLIGKDGKYSKPVPPDPPDPPDPPNPPDPPSGDVNDLALFPRTRKEAELRRPGYGGEPIGGGR